MALLTIPGMTASALEGLDTAPSGNAHRPFPCDAKGWTRQTAEVTRAELKTFNTMNGEKSSIAVYVANGDYGVDFLMDLDVRNVPPGTKDPEKAMQQAQSDLMKLIKVLGAYTGDKFDTDKLAKARGQKMEIIVRHKGFRGGESKQKFDLQGNNRAVGGPRWDGRETLFHDVQAIFKGEVPELEDVNDKGLPPFPTAPGAAPRAQSAPAGGFRDPFAGADDVPF